MNQPLDTHLEFHYRYEITEIKRIYEIHKFVTEDVYTKIYFSWQPIHRIRTKDSWGDWFNKLKVAAATRRKKWSARLT
jgi:hypothetical protein